MDPNFSGAPTPEPPKPTRGRRRGKDASAEPVTKKVVDRQRRFAIIFALAVGIVGALVVLGGTAPSTYVVRAKADVAAGTAIDPAAHLEAVAVPDEFIEDGALTGKSEESAMELATEDLTGLRVQYPLVAGQQVHADSFNVELTLSTPLEADERLVSVSAGIGDALAGQVKAGDRVDIAATDDDVTGVILNDVEIVSVTVSESQYAALASQQTGDNKDAKAEELLPGAPIPGIYVVRVSIDDAPRLLAADAGGELSLLYRGPEGDTITQQPMTAKSVICGDDQDLPVCKS